MLLGDLELNGGPAVGALTTVDQKFQQTTGSLTKLGSLGGAAFAGIAVAIAAVIGIASKFKEVLDLGGTLNDLSARTGIAVGELVILREAFDEAGLGADGVEGFFLKLQNAMGGVNEEGQKTSTAFEKLGIDIAEFKTLNAIGQIEALREGFAGIADQSDKVQISRNLFGKSGGQALSLLGDASVLDDARQRAGPLADIMERNVGAFDKLGDVLGSLKLDFQEFFAGALSKIAPEATSIAEALGSIDFVGIGEAVGTLAGTVLKLGEAFIAIAPAVNWISEKLSKIFGSGSAASAGLADKYRGFAKDSQGDSSGGDKSQVSALQKLGLGGGFSGGGGDPLLTENQRQTSVLEKINANISRLSTGGLSTGGLEVGGLGPVPV